jgi:rod shape-determining protein MreC
MESVLSRYKNLIVLAVVLVAQVLGLAIQVKRSSETESNRLIRIWAVSAVTPFEKAINSIQNGTWNIWHNYAYLRGVRAENRDLRQQIEQLRLEQARLSEDAAQARRLQALLAFKEQYIQKTVPAQVIGTSGSELSRSVFIDKGRHDGIEPNMAVITADGIVGKVLAVFPTTSQVLLINDQSSGAGGILEKSRLQGIVKGTSSGAVMLEYVMSDEQVQTGDKILTSGGDGIFPKGLPVGTVTRVSPGHELFLDIRIQPAANLAKLEEVLVVTEVVNREPSTADAGSARAVDILAQRLPSVPDKPADQQAAKSEAPAASTAAGPATSPSDSPAKPVVKPNALKPEGEGMPRVAQTANAPQLQSTSAGVAANGTAPKVIVEPAMKAAAPKAASGAQNPGSAAAAKSAAGAPSQTKAAPAASKPAGVAPANTATPATPKSVPLPQTTPVSQEGQTQ